jgi:hypothetical protein
VQHAAQLLVHVVYHEHRVEAAEGVLFHPLDGLGAIVGYDLKTVVAINMGLVLESVTTNYLIMFLPHAIAQQHTSTETI